MTDCSIDSCRPQLLNDKVTGSTAVEGRSGIRSLGGVAEARSPTTAFLGVRGAYELVSAFAVVACEEPLLV